MQTLETMKSRSQESLTNLMEKAKEQPDSFKTWGAAATGALVGALVTRVAASGALTILATLAMPPVALTVGAVGGGLLGWSYMHRRQEADLTETTPGATTVVAPTPLVTEASRMAAPVLPVETVDVTAPKLSDDLEAINGIGPVYAGRLRAAGVQTFAQLAELTPTRIQEIIGPVGVGHMIEAESWIAEARQFAERGAA